MSINHPSMWLSVSWLVDRLNNRDTVTQRNYHLNIPFAHCILDYFRNLSVLSWEWSHCCLSDFSLLLWHIQCPVKPTKESRCCLSFAYVAIYTMNSVCLLSAIRKTLSRVLAQTNAAYPELTTKMWQSLCVIQWALKKKTSVILKANKNVLHARPV